MTDKHEALRLADAMEAVNTHNADSLLVQMAAKSAAAELRRLHAENEALRAALAQRPRHPLGQQYIAAAWRNSCNVHNPDTPTAALIERFARAIEAAHGIDERGQLARKG